MYFLVWRSSSRTPEEITLRKSHHGVTIGLVARDSQHSVKFVLLGKLVNHFQHESPFLLHGGQSRALVLHIQASNTGPRKAALEAVQGLQRIQQEQAQGGQPLKRFLVMGGPTQ